MHITFLIIRKKTPKDFPPFQDQSSTRALATHFAFEVEADITSWNSCLAACPWQLSGHLLEFMQERPFLSQRCQSSRMLE